MPESATNVRILRAPFFGAKRMALLLRAMSDDDYYPLDLKVEGVRPKTSIRLPPELHADIEFIAKLWIEFDRVSGKKKSKKWKAHSVMEQFITVGRNKFAKSIGGLPSDEAGRKEYLKQAKEKFDVMVAHLQAAPKSSKK